MSKLTHCMYFSTPGKFTRKIEQAFLPNRVEFKEDPQIGYWICDFSMYNSYDENVQC